ncbi:Aspartic proteinase nepenthesin-1-like protein [Drosera capensis]
MASCHRSFILFVIAIILQILFAIPTLSASNNIFGQDTKTGIRVALQHWDAGKGFTKNELLSRAVQRGKRRWQGFASSSTTPFTAVSPTSNAGGENVFNMSIGTPPKSKVMICDTGSDLIWTQCKPCVSCFPQVTALFNPAQSNSYKNLSCTNQFCKALQSHKCDSNKNCYYAYGYGDGSSTQGSLGSETFTIGTTQGRSVSLQNTTFGCGNNNGGTFSEADGLCGLGQGPLSFPSQMPNGSKSFTYCIVDFLSTQNSHMYFGSLPSNKMPKNSQSTPIQKNSNYPTYYYVQIQGISINGKPLKYPQSSCALNKDDGSGGMIIDSGTTLTYLTKALNTVIKNTLLQKITNTLYPYSSEAGLSPCWYADEGPIPNINMTYHFAEADMTIPASSILIPDSSDYGDSLMCLVTQPSSPGIPCIFGNVHQQDFVFKYDLDNKKITFAPQTCSEW